MLKLNDITKKVLILSLSLAGFLSCVEIDQQQAGTVGYLAAPQLDVDVTVEDLNLTKTLDFEVEAPSVSDIRFLVKDKDGTVKYDGNGLWTNPIVLPVGPYTVQATAGENGFGAPYFTGSFSGAISALENESPALTMTLANALVNVTLSDDMKEHFLPGATVSFNDGAYETQYGQWCYIPAGEDVDVKLSISGLNSVGNEVTFAHTLTSPTPATAYMVTCGKETTDWPSISFSIDKSDVWASRIYITTPATLGGSISDKNKKVVYEAIPATADKWDASIKAVQENGVWVIKGLTPGTEYKVRASIGAIPSNVETVVPQIDGLSATAVHTTTNGELDGTDVTSAFAKSAVVKDAIESWSINVCKADGTVLRSGLSLGTSDGSAITSVTGWPYLPVGGYKLVVNASLKGGEVVSTEVPFNTSHPSFTVTATCKTTYDYYVAKDLNNANAVSGSVTAGVTSPSESLFDIGSSVSISPVLMQNTNYSKSVRYAALKDQAVVIEGTVDFGTSNKNSIGHVDGSFTDWRSYVLLAEVTFAGTTKEGTDDFHITGLPYSLSNNPHKVSWNLSGGTAEWQENVIHLNHSTSNSATLSFYLAGSVNTHLYYKLRIYTPTRLAKPKLTISSGGNDIASIEGKSGTAITATFTGTCSGQLSTSNSSVKCTRTYKYGREGDVWIDELDVTYR